MRSTAIPRTLFVVAVLLWILHRPLVEIAIDWLWFDAAGFLPIFTTTLAARLGLWAVGFVLGGLVVAASLRWAIRSGEIDVRRLAFLLKETNLTASQWRLLVRWVAVPVIGLPALLLAGAASRSWLDVLAWTGRTPFDQVDPHFGHDIGFYVFTLPVLRAAEQLTFTTLVFAAVAAGAYYVVRDLVVNTERPELSRAARTHLLFLGALLLAISGFGWVLDRYDLLFDRGGVVWGVDYADAHARIPAMWVAAVAAWATAVALLVSIPRDGWQLPGRAAVGYLVVRVLAVAIYPGIVQDYVVKPNELQYETEYLEQNIAATREAYALDRIEVQPFDADPNLTLDDIEANPLTIENVRVWDSRPLLTTYAQLQEIRLYYDFVDVDTDRYVIDGQLRQVMLSARELNYANVPAQAQGWINEHFQYTHGYGFTMSPVNVVTPEGLPDLFVKDIPPETDTDLVIEQSSIYYGEATDRYVFVNAGIDEFDYPLGDENAQVRYAGKGGVPMGGLLRQGLFSLYFGSFDILLSQYLQDDTRVMFRRRVAERVQHIAPFLEFDRDPYIVLADGRLVWMLDAYTSTRRYPYSEVTRITGKAPYNYMRNSVKVTVDAYDGTVRFYISDTTDPIIRAYSSVFPDAFEPLEALPESLVAHVRYPVDFFTVQAQMYRAYHMMDPVTFYNREDMWEFPRELYGGKEQQMESYYLIMKLPGEEKAEFVLLLPFVPTNKDNMISWLAARSDDADYGKLILYQFPKQKLIYGPRQIEARIDQDPDISQQITLWSQSGSRVVRGNLIVIPIERSLVYVEPLYLQAESSQLPELKRVIVSHENRIAMEPTLEEALAAVFGVRAPPAEAPAAGLTPDGTPALQAAAGWQALVNQAAEQFRAAESAQRAGDWAGYGNAISALSASLEQLEEVSSELIEAGIIPDATPDDAEAPPPPAP